LDYQYGDFLPENGSEIGSSHGEAKKGGSKHHFDLKSSFQHKSERALAPIVGKPFHC
jgi:hypothetical protein